MNTSIKATFSLEREACYAAILARDPRFDGVFFTVVHTTGIFCRNVCPVPPPKLANVSFVKDAQTALSQGYRPCLRCHPDSAPTSYAWLGTSKLVDEAMTMIEEDLMLSIDRVAAQLGVSIRHLQQTFKEHLGITPKQCQVYQRMLFAKYLLHQTDLSVLQIAQNCGYSSERRLQQMMNKYLQLSPSRIRKQHRIHSVSHANASHCLTLHVPVRAPYSWRHVRDFLNKRAINGMESVTQNSYQRTFQDEHHSGSFTAHWHPEKHHFTLDIQLNSVTNIRTLLVRIKQCLGIHHFPERVDQALINAGLDAALMTPGLVLPGCWSPWEALIRAILGQQISVNAAIQLLHQLHQLHWAKLPTEEIGFISPESLLSVDISTLSMTTRRKQTLRDVAKFVLDNPLTSEESVNALINVKGIGPWTINYVKLRGLMLPDVWLDSDLIIKQQLKKYTIDASKASPWRSYLGLQLWELANQVSPANK